MITIYSLAGPRQFVELFSLRSNFHRFLHGYEAHKSSNLNFIHSIKCLTMLLVILGHCILMHSVLPFANPEFVESVSCV